ncbi:Carboxypeptidase B [Eumeta japonica]|uniref:Carboxypeptidase B n=1 Tax=Eumeta variegata TaxID=151549 RepID=A0A4C1Y4X8_EUMVA|nr:Carboxypeptidase B [Eumeta japonica]
MKTLAVCCFLLLASLSEGRHEKYEGHQLFRVRGPAAEIAALEYELDLLSAKPATRSQSGVLDAVVRLSPSEREQWLPYFEGHGLSHSLIAENLAELLRTEEARIQSSRIAAKRSGKSISWDTYYRHEEINDYLDSLGAEYPQLVTVINAGLSYEGRQIKYVRISTTRFEDLRKPVIVIDAAVHAREWVTPPVALYIIHQLVVELAAADLTEQVDWIIIPVANPDGYEYSIDEDRLWRKTRSRSHANADRCPGVDGNRNFDHHWGTVAGNANPCTIVYEGPSAFSEPEIRVIRDAVLQNLNRASLYLSLHSYGNMFLYAWGNNGTLPSNGLILHLAGVTMATAIDALALPKADPYIVGNAANVLYFTTGTSRDWTRAVGVPLTYTVELPGYEYLFEVPPEYIEQIVTETWAGIEAGARFVLTMA